MVEKNKSDNKINQNKKHTTTNKALLLSTKKKEYKIVLFVLILILGFLIFKELRAYLSGFLAAGTLYILLRNQMYFFHQKKKWNRSLAATLITLETIFLILLPLTGLGFLVADTLSGFKIDPQAIMTSLNNIVLYIEEKTGLDIFTPKNLGFIPKVGTTIAQTLITNVSSLVINSAIAVFVLYFMLLEYKNLEIAVKELIPLNPDNKGIVTIETKAIIKANAIGIPLLAIIQGIFAYAGYLFMGIDNSLLYAVLTAFASIIPIIGTMIVWVPIAIGLFIKGNIIYGIIMAIYGFIVIGGIDNIVRFLLQKKLADIHPLITVFGVMLGIPLFGFLGVIFGPLLLSLFILFINMFRYEFIESSSAEPRVTKKVKKDNKLFKIKDKKRRNS